MWDLESIAKIENDEITENQDQLQKGGLIK